MMRAMWVVGAMLLCGCPGSPVYNNLFPPDPPPKPPAPAAPPRCTIATEIDELHNFMGELPRDASEDAAFRAALQFLVASGSTIENQDPNARTIITKRRDGQTLLSTCSVNRYFMYEFRVVIAAGLMMVNVECWTSTGWEASAYVRRDRGELMQCDLIPWVSKSDTKIPADIFYGTVGIMELANPSTSTSPGWWCFGGGNGTCFRSQEECNGKPGVDEAGGCLQQARAYCPMDSGVTACFGDLGFCRAVSRKTRQCKSTL
jgi:hypothetical protein